MAKTNLKKIIGNKSHWTINKSLAREIGLIETLILQHIIDLQSVFNKEEIFQSYEDMAEELGVSVYAIKNGIPVLKKLGLISVERKSVGFRNFYKIHEEVVLNYLNGGNLTSELNSTHWSVEGVESVDLDTTSELNSTLSELISTHQWVENDTTITNNTTNNTLQKINKKNTTTSSTGNLKNIVEKILDVLIDYESDVKQYNLAIDDFNELGGIDGISEILDWDDSVKSKWNQKIQNVYALK